jgi:hypothetical protein
MTDAVLANNNAILWTPYGSATIPLDLFTDTLTLGGGGVDGSVHVARGADDVATITLEADTGHITATNVYATNITAIAAGVATNTADITTNAAAIGWNGGVLGGVTTTVTAHTATLASHTASHASHTTALAPLTAATSLVDSTADADKPISTAGAVANASLLLTGNSHLADIANPHAVSAAQVGLGACDDTADLAKPVSTAQQAAIDVASMYRQPVVFMTGDVLPGATLYDPATGVITLPSAGELNVPGIGHVMAAGDRLLVAQQADTRENGVYIVSALGSNSTPYVVTRAPETLVGGMALTVQNPISR